VASWRGGGLVEPSPAASTTAQLIETADTIPAPIAAVELMGTETVAIGAYVHARQLESDVRALARRT